MSFVTHLVSGSGWTYAIVFGVVAVDALFPFVQAEAVVITASVLAAQGHLQIWLIVPVAALGGIVGDNGVYLLGATIATASSTASSTAGSASAASDRRARASGVAAAS